MEVKYIMKAKLSTEQKQKLVKKYYDGESVSVICLQSGVVRSTFYTWLKPHKTSPTEASLDICAADHARMRKHCIKLENMIKVLQSVKCTASSPLKEKLEELSKLYGKYSVYTLCDSLNVARGTFYNHMNRNKKDNSSYNIHREMLSKHIKRIYEESNHVYGSRKIKAVLNNRGYKTSERMVLELMQSMNLSSIRGKTKKQYNRYLKEGKKDRLKLNFTVKGPNQVWVSDTTYFKACNTSRYICAIIDLYSRKVISYKISKNNSTQLITSTFKEAYQSRRPSEELVFHSDRGVQYAAFAFRQLLNTLNITQSFSPKGNPYHNSVMESFFSNLKNEELYRINYQSIRDFIQHVDKSMLKYNYERPHATLLYRTPNAFEQAFYDNKN
jgi:putative transposase